LFDRQYPNIERSALTGSPVAVLQIQIIRTRASDELPFAQSVLNVGRAPDNDVILQDPQVSGHHLRIELASPSGQINLTDLGSTNGVKLNGQRIPAQSPVPMQFGDVLDLVEFRLSLRPPAPGDPQPVSGRVRLSAGHRRSCRRQADPVRPLQTGGHLGTRDR
jgi:pSer/pThr/pTyr-binding forkhead associated (FHA) protein